METDVRQRRCKLGKYVNPGPTYYIRSSA